MFSENSGTPQIIHFNRVFHFFHHPFWGTTIFGNTHIVLQSRFLMIPTWWDRLAITKSSAPWRYVAVWTCWPFRRVIGWEQKHDKSIRTRKMAVYPASHCWWLKSGKLTSWGKGSWNPIIYTWFYTSPNLKVCANAFSFPAGYMHNQLFCNGTMVKTGHQNPDLQRSHAPEFTIEDRQWIAAKTSSCSPSIQKQKGFCHILFVHRV